MLETLDYTIRIGSTPTFLYFDLYLYSAYAAHYVYLDSIDFLKKTPFELCPPFFRCCIEFCRGKDFCHLQRAKSTGGFLDRSVTGCVTSHLANVKYTFKRCDDVTYANHIC